MATNTGVNSSWYRPRDDMDKRRSCANPRHEELLSGIKVSRARLMNEAESRKREVTTGTFTTKKVKTLPDEPIASSLQAESTGALKVE